MWTQIVGKIRLTLSPWTNHSWHVTLYVTSRGLTTSSIPHGSHTFEIQFDFIDHQLFIDKSDGARRTIPLKPRSVAEFYGTVMKTLSDLELPVTINTMPNEIENPIPLIRMRSTALMIANMPTGFGACSCRAIACLRTFARVSAANAVRCIFSGAVLIWQ